MGPSKGGVLSSNIFLIKVKNLLRMRNRKVFNNIGLTDSKFEVYFTMFSDLVKISSIRKGIA